MDLDKAIKEVSQKYDVPFPRLRDNMWDFVNQLTEKGLIQYK